MPKFYTSPRWSGEILDCSMPMTFDTYDRCSFDCLYCFSYYQKSHNIGAGGTKTGKHDYQKMDGLAYVDPNKIKKLLAMSPDCSSGHKQFFPFIQDRVTIQWGGMADQFDMYEKKKGITLELLKLFKQANYPLCFSTKSTWWLKDERYLELFRNQDNWNVKFSIINLDPGRARKIERGVPSPQDRLEAIKTYSKLNKGGATLRLRPFIIGLSDKNDEYLDLIRQAALNGATALSTEFFCVEGRADDRLKERYLKISEVLGFDLLTFYKKNSYGAGYMRLNYRTKEKYIIKMEDLCRRVGMRFYVSDAHHKERCCNGSCCGLPESWNYSKGQFTQALLIAKAKGRVRFSDIAVHLAYAKQFLWAKAEGYNCNTVLNSIKRKNQSMYDYIREIWNTPNSAKSPYKYFNGILRPIGLDENKDVIYEYQEKKAADLKL